MKWFSFEEFERSETASRHGIENRADDAVRNKIRALVDNVLDPLREAWGGPVTVTSGYRCECLNKMVGGVKGSQHMAGEAADITTGNNVDNRRLFQLIIDLKLPFDQLIDESNYKWLHVSYSTRHRRQILKL